QRLLELSHAARSGGSRPAFAGGAVTTPIRPITRRPSLAPPSLTRCRIGVTRETPTRRDGNGLATFRRCTGSRLGRAPAPAERRLRAASSEGRSLSPCPFGPGLSAPLACNH